MLANTLKTLNYIKSSAKLDEDGKTCIPTIGSAALEATQRNIQERIAKIRAYNLNLNEGQEMNRNREESAEVTRMKNIKKQYTNLR